jgi:hypothetical protein
VEHADDPGFRFAGADKGGGDEGPDRGGPISSGTGALRRERNGVPHASDDGRAIL